MNIEIIKVLKKRAKEMLEDNYKRKIGDEEIYTIICELENFYTAYEKEKEANRKLDKEAQGYLEELAGDDSMNIRRIQELEAELEKEKENNKELRKYYATRKEVEELRKINECLHDSAENYITKDRVIEKVNEVKDRPVKDEFITASQGKLNTIIDIESLLDEEE